MAALRTYRSPASPVFAALILAPLGNPFSHQTV
jgi:hypothetical protein